MALLIDIERKQLEHCIDLQIASSRRAINTQKRPEFQVIYEKDIDLLTKAKASIREAPAETPKNK